MDTSHVADDLLTASTALAGLILVFVGNAAKGFDSYQTEQQDSVRAKYRRQGWLGVFGLVATLASAVLALLYNWASAAFIVHVSASLLLASLAAVCAAALFQVLEIG
jgi:hypothetical protein